MLSLTWDQVHAWRLERHFLARRAGREQVLDVAGRLLGVHAQLMPAAELSLAARVAGLDVADVARPLWQDRTLVKSWVARGTLHLVPAADYPLLVAAAASRHHFLRPSWLKYHGVTLEELEATLDAVRETLGETGLTRQELAEAVAARTGRPHLRKLLLSGWGALLKPAAFRGLLCFGPSDGQHVTFVSPQRWLGPWQPLDPQAALQEIAGRFLAAYGPATAEEFGRWWGIEPAAAKKVFRALAGGLVEVDVAGWRGWLLAESRPELGAAPAADTARLLPHFDAYTVALARQADYLMPAARKGLVYRPQGWISPLVLHNGRIAGVWEQERGRVTATLFDPATTAVRDGLAAEVDHLGRFLGAPLELHLTTVN